MGRFDEAYKILSRMAKVNKVIDFKQTCSLESMSKLFEAKPSQMKHVHHEITKKPNVSELFWPLQNLAKLVILFLIWNSINLNYSGVALSIITALDVNPFLMFLLSSIFEGLGLLICLTNDRLGRKRGLFIQLFLVSFCSFLVSLLPDELPYVQAVVLLYVKMGLALIARGIISASYNTIYVFASELYEVKIRSTAILFLSSGGCLSTLLAPQVNMLRVFVWKPLPYIIYGSTTLLSSLIIFFLPETYRHHH